MAKGTSWNGSIWCDPPGDGLSAGDIDARPADDANCKHCGGRKAERNPTGSCDHLYWPDYLTPDAKRANGFLA